MNKVIPYFLYRITPNPSPYPTPYPPPWLLSGMGSFPPPLPGHRQLHPPQTVDMSLIVTPHGHSCEQVHVKALFLFPPSCYFNSHIFHSYFTLYCPEEGSFASKTFNPNSYLIKPFSGQAVSDEELLNDYDSVSEISETDTLLIDSHWPQEAPYLPQPLCHWSSPTHWGSFLL